MASVNFDESDFELLISVLGGELSNINYRIKEAVTEDSRAFWLAEKARVEALSAKVLASIN